MRKPLGSLSLNVQRGPDGPRRRENRLKFAEEPVMITPEPHPVSRAETEERKSAFVSRTREAGQTPYKYIEDTDEELGKPIETPVKEKEEIFNFDYAYHSDVKPKVNRKLEVEIYVDNVVSSNNHEVDGVSVEHNGGSDKGVTLEEANVADRVTLEEDMDSPVRHFSPSLPPKRVIPAVDSPAVRSIERATERCILPSPTGTKTPLESGTTTDCDKEFSSEPSSAIQQLGSQERHKSEIIQQTPPAYLESSASGKKSPAHLSGPTSFYESKVSPQRQSLVSPVENLAKKEDRTEIKVNARRSEEKGTVASSVELPSEATSRNPLTTPSSQIYSQQTASGYEQHAEVSVCKPRMGGRRALGTRNANNISSTTSTASHPHRPDRPDRESIPRPEPAHGYSYNNFNDRVIARIEKCQVSDQKMPQWPPRPSQSDEEKFQFSRLQLPQQQSIDDSDVMWTTEGTPLSNFEAYKRDCDQSVNYSMSRDIDNEFRSLNDLMESFMLRTQDNYFYCRDDKVVVKKQQKQVMLTKNANAKKPIKSKKAISGPPLRVFTYGNEGASPDSSAVDDSLFDNSRIDESSLHFGQNAPYLSQAISSPVNMDEVEHDLDVTAMTASTTTMSVVDNSYLDDSLGGEAVIAFNSKKDSANRALSLEEDMKEVTLSCAPLDFTTLVLTFRNQRKRQMTLNSAAILIRFDKLGQFWDANKSSCNQSSLLAPSGSVFQVSPRILKLEAGARANLYVTFSPNQQAQGIYSGALKIKSKGKSFVLLLRGEARRDSPDRALLEGPDVADASVQANLDVDSCAPQTSQTSQTSQTMVDIRTGLDCETDGDTNANIGSTEPLHISPCPSFRLRDYEGEKSWVDEVPRHRSMMASVTPTGRWLCNWVKREIGIHGDSNGDTISLANIVTLDSDGHGMLIIENKSSLPVVLEMSLSSDDISISDTRATINPRGKFTVSLFTKSLSQHVGDDEHCSPTKSHLGFITVTAIGEQKDYIVDIRRGYKIPRRNVTTSIADKPAPIITPQKTFLWPSVTQPLGTIDRVSHTLQLETPLRNLPPSSRSVFFRSSVVQFKGPQGMLTRERVDLCNTTDQRMNIRIEDPDLPFVLLHNEISIEAKSYVSVPIRFVPVSRREYRSALHGSSLDGIHKFSVTLIGASEN